MSKFIFTFLLVLGLLPYTNAQTIQQVDYTSVSTDMLLFKKFKNIASSRLHQAIAEMTLRGETSFQNYTFKKTGKLRDRVEIMQTNSKGEIAFQLEILESTFLHFLNAKETAQEQEQKRMASERPLLTLSLE